MMWLDHGAQLFDHADYIIERLTTIATTLGVLVGIVMGIRAKIQNWHAETAVAHEAALPYSNEDRKANAMAHMATAGVLVRASPARADKLIEKAVEKRNKARKSIEPKGP